MQVRKLRDRVPDGLVDRAGTFTAVQMRDADAEVDSRYRTRQHLTEDRKHHWHDGQQQDL